jgi:hypothetical protein
VAAEQFAAPRLGMKIDAVVAIDFYTIAKLLEVTGPLRVPGYGVTVTSQNFVPLVVQGGIQSEIQSSETTKAILAATAGPLMERVASLPSQQWPSLISILNGLASTRHLQAFFNNSTVQDRISTFGWSGQLNPHKTSEFMMETEANLGATKANYFLTRRYDVVLTRQGSLLHHLVTVTVTDNMPYVYRPNEFYRAYFRLFFPANASSARDDLTQLRWPNPSPPAGLHQLAGWIQIHGYGHSAQVTFSYDTPWQADRLGRDEIYWQKQPGTLDDAVHVTWNDNGRRFSASGSLHQDLTVELTTNGVALLPAAIATAAIPSLSLG